MADQNSGLSGSERLEFARFHDVAVTARNPRSLAQVGAWKETIEVVEQQIASLLGTSLPSTQGYSITNNEKLVMTIAPGTFIVESQELGVADTLATIIKPDMGTVTDLTDARAALNIAGKGAESVLSTGLAIDLSLLEFPVHRVTQTGFDGIGVIIRRVAEQEFDLYVYASFAQALRDWLTEAGNRN